MTEYIGWTHKFTIGNIDCYLKIGTVGPDDWERFKHMSIGDICYLDLTVSKQVDELRIYEVLFELVNKMFECGGSIKDACDVMRSQQILPRGSTTNEKIPMCTSIVDYIAKYLDGR
jgi:hypothetical protein